MEYFERVKEAASKFKTLIIIIIGIIAIAAIYLCSAFSTRSKFYSDDRLQELFAEEIFIKDTMILPISELDYNHYNEMGFQEVQILDSNQKWLNDQIVDYEYANVKFDGVNMGKNACGCTDYSLLFYNMEFDPDATYEIHVYTAMTLENIEFRFGSDQCFYISSGTIDDYEDGFILNYTSNEKFIPYTFIECCEYKDGKQTIYDHALIYDQDGYVTVYR